MPLWNVFYTLIHTHRDLGIQNWFFAQMFLVSGLAANNESRPYTGRAKKPASDLDLGSSREPVDRSTYLQMLQVVLLNI